MSFTSQESLISNETFGKDASFKLPQLIGSMSISPSGRDVVLGSKEGLHVIDLDSPYSPPRFLPHRTSWEVADVQWSPFADRDYWVVSTSNQKALVWNLNLFGWRNSIQHVLHGHTRAITDINFSAHHPDKLATCAVDSFVHCWDLRTPERPVMSFSDWFAGATQVKWSRQDENVIASSHDKYLHIWDIRKGAMPARTIEAHTTKIYGIDWNRFEPSKIVTCSLDKTIKFWDTNNTDDIPERVIETAFPVWRARHTPFGWGLMVMPQRGSGDLHLYDRRSVNGKLQSGRVKPVHIFPGHQGNVKEFLWRFYGTVKDGIDHRDFQLVSWGTDRELKLHTVFKETLEDVGYEKGVSRPQRLRFTRRGAKYRTFRDEPSDVDSVFTAPGRTDSFPSSSQFARTRGRLSTNMGMSRSHLTQWKGGLSNLKRSKNDMHGKGTSRPGTDAIAWMKNVKISSWDPDVLADEVTQAAEKFKNVDFEAIDLSHRRITLSLQSSWGEDEASSAYTRLDLKFPKDYPREAQAIVYVQKTNSLTSHIQHKLTLEARQIAEVFKVKGRGCIEAIIRYLLREQTLQEIIIWVMRDSLTGSKLMDTVDPEEPPAGASDDSDDDQMADSVNATKLNAQFNVPHPKGCAALWAENGKLVCFFKKRDDEPSSLLASLGTSNLDSTGAGKLFGGFGNLQTDSISRKMQSSGENKAGSSDDESDASSIFSSSTSSSDSSFGFKTRNRFVPLHRTTMDSPQKIRSGDGSQKSTHQTGVKLQQSSADAIIHIHDFSELLNTRRNAAQDHQIHGNQIELIKHNYEVIKQYPGTMATRLWGHVYQLADRFLRQTELHHRKASAKASAKPTTTREWEQFSIALDHMLCKVMQALETSHDTQQLAMFGALYLQQQQSRLERLLEYLLQAIREDKSATTQFEPPPTRQAGIRSTVSYQTSRTGSFLSTTTTQNHHELTVNTPDELSTSVPTSSHRVNHSYSTRNSSAAPSVVAHDPSGLSSTIHSQAVSLAGSPESNRTNKASFLAGFPGLYQSSRSRPSSPPAQSSRSAGHLGVSSFSARASPDDGFFSEARSKLKTSISLVNVSRASQGKVNPSGTGKGSNHKYQKIIPPVPMKIKRMKTELAGLKTTYRYRADVANDPDWLFNCRKCVRYIQQYIPQLEVWQLWMQRAEFVKICVTAQDIFELLGQNQEKKAYLPTNSLRVLPRCIHCGEQVKQDNEQAELWRCSSSSCPSNKFGLSVNGICSICEIQIKDLTIPCLLCRHSSCYSCAQEWFNNIDHDSDHDRSRLNSTASKSGSGYGSAMHVNYPVNCPTGCGCQCNVANQYLAEIDSHRDAQSLDVASEPRSITQMNLPEDMEVVKSLQGAHRLHRGHSVGESTALPPESAIHALLALQNQSRHRSTSSKLNLNAQADVFIPTRPTRTRVNSLDMKNDLVSWKDDPSHVIGRGRGAGLTRTLSSKGSDATIRRLTNQ